VLTPCSGCRMPSTSALVWLRASQTNQQDALNRETSHAYPITEDATPGWLHLPRSPTIWVIWHSICGPHPHLSCQILTDGIPVKSNPPDHRALLSITVTRSRSNLLMVLHLLPIFTLEMIGHACVAQRSPVMCLPRYLSFVSRHLTHHPSSPCSIRLKRNNEHQ
jgi:hypothetical protein